MPPLFYWRVIKMYEYNAIVTNVVDGDTFDLSVDLGFNIFHNVRVRLLQIDTPEKFGEEKELGLICKEYATKRFLGKKVLIHSEKEDLDMGTDSFGRYLVYLWEEDGTNVINLYNQLGINKKFENTYSVNKVKNLPSYT